MSKDWYSQNSQGYYPRYSGSNSSKIDLNDTLDAILYIMHKNIREQRLRHLINDVFEYLEKNAGFHFGVSDAYEKLKTSGVVLTSKNVVLEHAVPSTVIIAQMKKTQIINRKSLLNFLMEHYFICLINNAENQKLSGLGLHRRMPQNWNNDWVHWDVRYKAAGIKLKVKPGL